LINLFLGLTGGLLLTYGLYAAIFAGSPYWYSYFVIGLFLFLDRCDAFLNQDSNLNRLCNHNWRTPVYTYLVYLAGALMLDLLIGSYIGKLWVYPHFNLFERFINVILIGYPFAFFSCAAFYRVLVKLLRNFPRSFNQSNTALQPLGMIILIITIVSTIFPILYFLLFGNLHIQGIIILCSLIGVFSLSPVSLIMGKKSLLQGILNLDWPVILALLLSIPVNALAHELPNTFAWEWRYQNLPFGFLEILGIPVIVFTVGWTYLTIFGISGNELFFDAPN
jgi:hypothetical protein